jgi:hypothetical protein
MIESSFCPIRTSYHRREGLQTRITCSILSHKVARYLGNQQKHSCFTKSNSLASASVNCNSDKLWSIINFAERVLTFNYRHGVEDSGRSASPANEVQWDNWDNYFLRLMWLCLGLRGKNLSTQQLICSVEKVYHNKWFETPKHFWHDSVCADRK